MKNTLTALLFVLAMTTTVSAQTVEPKPERIAANPSKNFSYPYYLFVPKELAEAKNQKQTLLVLPNNSGKTTDDFEVQESDVKRRMVGASSIASALKVAVLMPVFPRPGTDWRIYTHALDRDTMLTTKTEYRRLDLQLIAMIDDARRQMDKKLGLKFDRRVLVNGYSASGMFANRFTFLHPDRIKAAAIGSPGGWPIAPVGSYEGKELRYPIGVADFKKVSGKKLDLAKLRKVPLLIFVGDQDENDSVPFDDSYDQEDRDLINPLLGKTPVSRWPISEQLYKQAGMKAEFKLYPGVKHTVNEQMRDDIRAFLLKYR